MNTKLKEILESAWVTFLATFLLTVLPFIGDITMELMKSGAFFALIVAAARVAVKETVLVIIPFIKSLKK